MTDTQAHQTPPPTPPYLESLNESQRSAVEKLDGPVLILAGAGTGKTRVLTTRLAHLLMLGKAKPWEILCVTFTNKAAREMRERVASLLGYENEGWWVGTFHAQGARILRSHAEAIGLRPTFSIIDTDDQVRLVKQILAANNVDEKNCPARMMSNLIQRWKDRGLPPEKIKNSEGSEQADGMAPEIYAQYQDRLRTLNAADFGDLLMLNLTLFQNEPDILAKYQSKFRYILVDEYQDTNVAQYLWLRLLASGNNGGHANICCVGDDDQAIYSWRGAEVGNILRFESDFPGAQVVRLERNYRSTPHILAAASGLISHNEGRFGKTLWTDIDGGEKVRVHGVWDGVEEARYISSEIEALHSKGHKLNEVAVLVRVGFQTREFEDRLLKLALPYRVLGGMRFYERAEIRDAVAYLRVIAQRDDDLALERIINVPKRTIGTATVQTLHHFARAENISLYAAILRLLETDEIRAATRKKLRGLMDDFERWRSHLNTMRHSELAELVLDESGYTAMWQVKARSDNSPEALGKLDNLKEMIAALEDYEDLTGFLEHVALVMDNEENDATDKVTLMTLHGAKGLEFDTVFLPGWEEELFPHQRALDESGTAGLEEERRLAYVGLTRARERSTITFAANRRIYNQWKSAIPSRFIDELPAEHISVESASGLYGSYRGRGSNERNNVYRDKLPNSAFQESQVFQDSFDAPSQEFEIGERVFHQKFGYGTILHIDGNKLEVAFEKSSTKKVMDSFVEKA